MWRTARSPEEALHACLLNEEMNEWMNDWLDSCTVLLVTSWLWSPGFVPLLAAYLVAVSTWLAFSHL